MCFIVFRFTFQHFKKGKGFPTPINRIKRLIRPKMNTGYPTTAMSKLLFFHYIFFHEFNSSFLGFLFYYFQTFQIVFFYFAQCFLLILFVFVGGLFNGFVVAYVSSSSFLKPPPPRFFRRSSSMVKPLSMFSLRR